MFLTIFGTSKITTEHIKSAKKNGIKIYAISTFRNIKEKKSIQKKFKNIKIYFDYRKCINDSLKIKNCHFLITSSIKNNEKLLNKLTKFNRKIIIEKPVFLKSSHFNKYIKYKKNIFVGYNRVFYNNIKTIKNLLSKYNLKNVHVKIPESSKSSILTNSCHVLSLVNYLLGDIKKVQIIKNTGYIFSIFKTKKNKLIFFDFNFKSPENFSIEFNFTNFKCVLSPIETIKIYKGLAIKEKKSMRIYQPILKKHVDESHYTKNKPGFDNQYKIFKNFVKGKINFYPDIVFSKNIIKICNLFL